MQKPSRLFPSSTVDVAGGGVIDATQQNTFTAVLGGARPVNAYQLICRKNSADNTIVYNTGVVTLDEPFYPVNTNGDIVPFNVDVPASSAALTIEDAYVSGDDYDVINITTNVPAYLSGDESGIYISSDGGSSWDPIHAVLSSISFTGTLMSIALTESLVGGKFRIKIEEGTISPVDEHYSEPSGDLLTSTLIGYVPNTLEALHLSSAYVAAGTSFTATVQGSRSTYVLNRSGTVSIKSGNTEYASRVSDATKISYSILNGTIYFFVGSSVPTGTYTVKYTDPLLDESPDYVTASLVVAATGTLSYHSITTDADRLILVFHMSGTVTVPQGFAGNVRTSTDGGTTWTNSNPVLGAAAYNEDATYTKDAVHDLSVEFTNPIENGTMIRLQIGTATVDTQAVYFVDDEYVQSADTEDTWAPVDNQMVNGGKYKWVIRVWTTYSSAHKTDNMVESYEACFDAYNAPIMSIMGDAEITQRNATWTGSYSQAQDVPLMWHEWTISAEGSVLDSSGRIYSSVAPSFTYNGLLTDTTYEVKLVAMNQVGVTGVATFESSVSYTELGVEGSVTVNVRSDGSVAVNVKQAEYISGEASGLYEYAENVPVEGHTSVVTGPSTVISFQSTRDFGVDWDANDYVILRAHSVDDGILLDYTSDDGSFNCELSHRGLVGGYAPSASTYPSIEAYPSRDKYGEFVYKVNDVEVATFTTDKYGFCWYTIVLTQTDMTVFSYLMY